MKGQCPPDGDLKEDYAQGAIGNHLSQLFTGLQAHKTGMHLAQQWAERANRIGWHNAGIDVAKIDEEMKAAGEDVDQSIRLSGDTHIHVGAGAEEQPQPAPQPQPQPKPAPQQPQPEPPQTMPTWAKWLVGLSTAALLGSGGATAYTVINKDQAVVAPGGSRFDFETELPPWMQSE